MRFHWFEDLKTRKVQVLRFTRALFGLAPLPFLLGGVIKEHLETYRNAEPKCVEEIERSLYVDDLISGGQTVQEAQALKTTATEIFSQRRTLLCISGILTPRNYRPRRIV